MDRRRIKVILIARIVLAVLFVGMIISIIRDIDSAKERLDNSIFHSIPSRVSKDMREVIDKKYKYVPYSSIRTLSNDSDTLYYFEWNSSVVFVFQNSSGSSLNAISNIVDPKSRTISNFVFMDGVGLIYEYPKNRNSCIWKIDNGVNKVDKCGLRLSISLDEIQWNYVFVFSKKRCFVVDDVMANDRLFTCIEVSYPR